MVSYRGGIGASSVRRTNSLFDGIPHVKPRLVYLVAVETDNGGANDGEDHDEYGKGKDTGESDLLAHTDLDFPQYVYRN